MKFVVTIRALCFAALVVVAAGCADDTASGYLPKKTIAGNAVRHTTVAASALAVPAAMPLAAPAVEIDVPTIVRDATRIPAQLRDLRRTIYWGALSICVVGLANAGLLLTLVLRRHSEASVDREMRAARKNGNGAESVVIEMSATATPVSVSPMPSSSTLATLAVDLHVAPDRYGYPVAPLVVAGAPLVYGAIPRQPGPVRDDAPRGERRRCACGEPVAPRARARRCEACAKTARARAKRPATLAS